MLWCFIHESLPLLGLIFIEKPFKTCSELREVWQTETESISEELRTSVRGAFKILFNYSYSLHTQHSDGWVDLTKSLCQSWIKFVFLLRSQSSLHVLMRLKSNEGKQNERLVWLKQESRTKIVIDEAFSVVYDPQYFCADITQFTIITSRIQACA